MGGVTVNVPTRLPIGGSHDANGHVLTQPTGYIKAGKHQKLGGYEALWFARSRFNSDDYHRMERQRCMVGALVAQSNPVKMLKKYPQLARVAKKNISTDIPRQDLPAWVTLVERMQGGKITSLPFTSSVVNTSNPDFDKIHTLVRKAIRASAAGQTPTTDTTTTGTSTTKPGTTPTSSSKSQNVSDVC
jgi:anionic cell wall polymer biosynthesis LytR-Cps2A-Psr (LCP) family protein